MNAMTSSTLLEALASSREQSAQSHVIKLVSLLFMTALTAAAAQVSVPLPFSAVPLTFQPPVVLLCGLVLGSRLGAMSQILYLTAGIAGLPVFATSLTLPPGPLRLLGPTGGYLMAYPIAAYVTGYLAERGFDRRYLTSILAMSAGLAVLYICGATWLALFARTASGSAAIGISAALTTGVLPFVLPDFVKLAAAATVVPGLWRIIGSSHST